MSCREKDKFPLSENFWYHKISSLNAAALPSLLHKTIMEQYGTLLHPSSKTWLDKVGRLNNTIIYVFANITSKVTAVSLKLPNQVIVIVVVGIVGKQSSVSVIFLCRFMSYRRMCNGHHLMQWPIHLFTSSKKSFLSNHNLAGYWKKTPCSQQQTPSTVHRPPSN